MSFLSQLFDRNLKHRIPFVRIGSSADRRHQRYSCYVVSSLALINRPLTFDGIVDSISANGMQFRPASSYLLDRRGEMVSIDVNTKTYYGTIVAARQSGYGIVLTEPIPEHEILDFLNEYDFSPDVLSA